MSKILDRLKNLENDHSAVLRTADMVPSRSVRSSKRKSRKRVILFVSIIFACLMFGAYHFRALFLPAYPVAVPAAVDLAQAQNQQNDRAIASYKSGDFSKSVEVLESLVKQHPKRAEFHVNLAMALQQVAKLEKAQEHLELAITLEPNESAAHNNLGLVALRLKDAQLAEKSFVRAHELNPKSPEILFNLASFYEKTGQLKKSADAYDKYVSHPNADKTKVELLKKRVRRLNSLSAQGLRAEEEEGA